LEPTVKINLNWKLKIKTLAFIPLVVGAKRGVLRNTRTPQRDRQRGGTIRRTKSIEIWWL